MASICCSPPDRVPACWKVRSFRRGKDGFQILLDTVLVIAEKGSQFQIFHDGERSENSPSLRYLGYARLYDRLGFHLVKGFPVIEDGPFLGMEKSGYGTKGSRLACTVGADEGDDLSFFHFQ